MPQPSTTTPQVAQPQPSKHESEAGSEQPQPSRSPASNVPALVEAPQTNGPSPHLPPEKEIPPAPAKIESPHSKTAEIVISKVPATSIRLPKTLLPDHNLIQKWIHMRHPTEQNDMWNHVTRQKLSPTTTKGRQKVKAKHLDALSPERRRFEFTAYDDALRPRLRD